MTVRTVCLTGGTGFVGRHLVERLRAEQGITLRVLTRRQPDLDGVMFIRGDLLDIESLSSFVDPGATIVHLAYAANLDNAAAARNLCVAAARKGISKFIHVSTAAVVGQTRAEVIDEETPCNPRTIYQREKLEIETIVRRAFDPRTEYTILRPTAIFGPGGKNLLKLASELATSPRAVMALRIMLMKRRQMNLVAVENVAEAIVWSMRQNLDALIIVNDDEADSDYERVAAVLQEELAVAPFPSLADFSVLLSPLLRVSGRDLSNPRSRFSAARLRRTGYRPAIGFDDALRKFGHWFRSGDRNLS